MSVTPLSVENKEILDENPIDNGDQFFIPSKSNQNNKLVIKVGRLLLCIVFTAIFIFFFFLILYQYQ